MQCRACLSQSVDQILDFGSWPIVHHLKQAPSDLREEHEFVVGVCKSCGLLQLVMPIDPEILYKDYFTLSSWKNNPHIDRLIWLLTQCSGVEESSEILEIGCNDGSFLEILKRTGYNSLYGIEPSEDAYLVAKEKKLDVEHGFFGIEKAQAVSEERGPVDLLVCRQVLEHVADLPDFMTGLNHVLAEGAPLLLEVPDAATNIFELDYGFWEEHVNYFTENTLKSLLSTYGFRVAFTERVVFSGNTIIVLAFKDSAWKTGSSVGVANAVRATSTEVDCARRMGELWSKFRLEFRSFLGEQSRENKKTVIYGCGARSSTLANFLGLEELVHCFVDDQTEKQGYFVPGSNLQILSADAIPLNEIDTVLLGVNAENEEKVMKKLSLKQSEARCYSILAPSRHLPRFWQKLIFEHISGG